MIAGLCRARAEVAAVTAVAALALGACRLSHPVISDLAAMRLHAGKFVEIHGTSENADLGAVIIVRDTPVYCEHVDEWPVEVVRESVVATGTLEQTDKVVARPTPDGSDDPDHPLLQSAGTPGPIWILRGCAARKSLQ